MGICSEVVPKVIDAFEKGTPMFKQLEEVRPSHLYINRQEAELVKISIMDIACLVAVIMNYIFWKDLDIEHSGLLDFDVEANNVENNEGKDDDGTLPLVG